MSFSSLRLNYSNNTKTGLLDQKNCKDGGVRYKDNAVKQAGVMNSIQPKHENKDDCVEATCSHPQGSQGYSSFEQDPE